MSQVYLRPIQLGAAEQAWGANASAGATGATTQINTEGGILAKSIVCDITCSDIGSGVTGSTVVANVEFKAGDMYSVPGAALIIRDITTQSGATGVAFTAAEAISGSQKRVELVVQDCNDLSHVFAHASGVTGSPIVSVIGC